MCGPWRRPVRAVFGRSYLHGLQHLALHGIPVAGGHLGAMFGSLWRYVLVIAHLDFDMCLTRE